MEETNLVEAPVESNPADDIRKVFTVSKTAPEEAAKNLDRANLFGVKPDTYAGLKDQLDPEADAIERTPTTIEPVTADFLKQSEQHLALAKEDISKLNWIEKKVRYGKNQIFDVPETQREINEIMGLKMDTPDGKLDDGTETYLQELTTKMNQLNTEAGLLEKKDIGEGVELATDVFSAAGDMIRGYYDNKEIMAGMIGGSTAIGAGIGAFTPLTAVVGAKIGFAKGAYGATMVAGFLDGYKQTSRGMMYELTNATNDQGQNLNLPHDRKVMISYGTGVMSGLASGIAGYGLAKANPLLRKLSNPAMAMKVLSKNPAMMAKMEILGAISKGVLTEGAEEGFQEWVQTVGGIFGKMDESEASFMNALEESTSAENLKKYGRAALVGGLTGGVFETVTSAPGYGVLKKEFQKAQEVTENKKRTLTAQNDLLEIANEMKNTKMNELAPHELSNFNKKLMGLLGVDEKIYFQLEDLRQFANSPEKGEAVRKIIDPKGEMTKMAQELNVPVEMDKSQLLQIMTEFPELSDFMRLTPEGENPLAIRNEGKEFATKLGEVEAKREELLASLGTEEMTPEQQKILEAETLAPVKDSKYFNSREEYLNQSTLQPIEGIVSQKEVDELNEAHLAARQEVDEMVVAPVDKKADAADAEEFKSDTQAEIEVMIKNLSKEYETIDKFSQIEIAEADSEFTAPHWKPGFSKFAIDPRKLSEVQKAIYFNKDSAPSLKRNLKQRKVFVNGGLDIEEAASLLGVENGDQLLKILAETPTKKQVEQRIKKDPIRKVANQMGIAENNLESRQKSRDEAFSKITRFHIKEMDVMTKKDWNVVKRGIIKIARKVPTVEELNAQAKAVVQKMTIRNLNANRFKVGESKSQKQALTDFVSGKIEQAFANKEKAALNNELRKETMNAQDKVEKAQRFWKKVTDPSSRQELKDAGMSDVMEDFMSVFKMDGNVRSENEQKSFNEWVKRQVAEGNWVPEVPDRLNNTQASYKDLTVEQYIKMTEMGQFIMHQAKLKNKLLKKRAALDELETAETVAEGVEENAKAHFKFDPKNAEKKAPRHLSPFKKWKKGAKTAASTISSIKTVISELDEYKLDGYFHRLIGKPIKDAFTAKRMEIKEIADNDKKIIEAIYGSVEKFKPLMSEYVKVPELADVEDIGDGEGNILKSDLLVMLAYMGDPDGKAALGNYKTRDGVALTDTQIMTVLETHLTDQDADFVQNFMVNRFKRFEQRSFEMHERVTGTVPEMIKGSPFVFKGKVYLGGYYPIRRTIVSDADKAEGFLENIKDIFAKDIGVEDEGYFFAKMRTAEMTQQGRMKDRTGSQRPVDLNFENVFEFTEEAVHDLHFREVGIDTLKILKNPFNVRNMKSVVGPEKFVALLNGVKDVVSKTTERETVLFAEEYGLVNRVIAKAHTLHAVKAIGFRLTSAAVQADSLANLMLRVGPKAGLYLGKHATKMAQNLSNYEEYVKLASEINHDIGLEQDQIDNAINKNSYEWMPVGNAFYQNYPKLGKGVQRIREMQKKAIDGAFWMVREADKFNKTLATLAIADMFLAGDVDGFDSARLEKMSDAEKAEAMRSVIQQAIDLSLTANSTADKTALEKNKVANILVRYWTDRRSRLNSVLAQVDKARGAYRRGNKGQAAKHMLTLSVAMGGSAAWIAMVRNEEESIFKQLAKIDDGSDAAEFAANNAWGFITAPIDQTLDTVPFVDNIKYQVMNDKIPGDYRNVKTPLFDVASDMAMGLVVMKDILKSARKLRTPKLNDNRRKALLTNMGYIAGGAPTNAMWDLTKAMGSNKVKKLGRGLKEDIMEVHEEIDKFIEAFGNDKEAQEFIEDLKEYKKELPQYDTDVKNVLPENAKEDLKAALSGGDWKAYDKVTGAAGLYQFTEERWNELKASNPELGLTDNGRVAKDQSQQEKAFEWELSDNTRGLLAYEIEPTLPHLLGAHEFGFDNFVAIYQAADEDKLSDIIGEDLARKPAFGNFETAGDAKKYLAEKNGVEYEPRLKLNKFQDDAIEEVLDVEGGYVNHKNDRGGATKFGVTQKTFNNYMTMKTGKPYKSKIKEIKEMDLDTAKDVYKTLYWKEIEGDQIKKYDVAVVLLDQAINRGPQTVIKQVQEVLGLDIDGHMGEETVKALNEVNEDDFLKKFLARAEKSYKGIIKNDRSQKVFKKGWEKRINDLKDKIGDN